MQSQNKFFDDLSRLATGAAGTMAGMGREMEGRMKERLQEFVGGMDMVSREEFDAVKELAANARAEVEALRVRLDALEGKPSTNSKPTATEPKKTAGPENGAE